MAQSIDSRRMDFQNTKLANADKYFINKMA